MIKKLYSVRDSVADQFMAPSVADNDNVAIRDFRIAMNRTDLFLYQNPQDFDLFCIGTYDTNSGLISPVDPPKNICTGLAALEVKNVQN